MWSFTQRFVLIAAAVAEAGVVLLTPRVVTVNGQRLSAAPQYESLAPALDLTSIAAYSIGIVVIAGLLCFALTPERRVPMAKDHGQQ